MAEFLSTDGIAQSIDNILSSAKTEVGLIGPYLAFHPALFLRMKRCLERGVRVTIVYGKSDRQSCCGLADLEGVQLFYRRNIRAKCYYNESQLLVGSMTWHAFEARDHREMGILLDAVADADAFERAKLEARSIISSAVRLRVSDLAEVDHEDAPLHQLGGGTCIRCSEEVPFDPARALCRECHFAWARFEDAKHLENYCHACGAREDTSVGNPVCRRCARVYATSN